MNYYPLTKDQREWKDRTEDIAEREIGPRAAGYDSNAEFPQESLNALRDAGLWSMRVPKKYGGLGLDLVTTCLIVEEISKKCPSTAMCYKMHLEAVEAISQIPTNYQLKRYIEPLLKGEVFAAAPGGEPAGKTGDDWTPVPQTVTTLSRVQGGLHIDHVRKSYVTSAGHATHYIMFCRVEGGRTEGPPELLMFKNDEVEWETVGEWNGLGMRGNSSVPMIFNGVVPEENLVGIELEDKSMPVMTKYMSPCLILTYGAAYLGIASGAFDIWGLLTAASIGNILGAVVNWWLGRCCLHRQDRRWFPLKGPGLDRAGQWFNRYGVWLLFLAWVPIIGDPLTFTAGVLRVPFILFLVLVSVSKTGRYLVLLGIVKGLWL